MGERGPRVFVGLDPTFHPFILAACLVQISILVFVSRTPHSVRIQSTGAQGRDKLFIAVMTGAGRSPVLDVQSSTWRYLISHPLVSDLRFFGWNPVQTTLPYIVAHYVDTPVERNDTSWNYLCSKMSLAVRLFVASSANWFLRVCDDCVINLATFPLFYRELTEFADPLENRVIQGHLIGKKGRQYVYPQGGSGIVFSRFTANEIVQERDSFLHVCVHIHNDDRGIGIWMLKHNVSAWDATNRWFVGHTFLGQKGGAVTIPGMIDRLERCPARPVAEKGIRPYFNRANDIAFWHDRVPFPEFGPFVPAIRRKIPDNVWFYPGMTSPGLCIGDNPARLGYYNKEA
jgi:hypothetical protein